MTTVIVAACGTALGVIGIFLALNPTPQSLKAALADLDSHHPRGGGPEATDSRAMWIRLDRRLAKHLVGVVSSSDYLRSRLWPYFAITGISAQKLFGEVILIAAVGFMLPVAWWTVVGIAGVQLPLTASLWAGLLLGCSGAALPLLALRSRARRARLSARKAVGSFLNLVVLSLAGGMGIESALFASAHIGEGGVSKRISAALAQSHDTGEPPWDALDRLGRELNLVEITELAAAVVLAGTEGARIRSTLVAKASSIRRHALADAESEANRMTERLFLPGVCLLVGFLAFIAYPAVARISSGL